MLEGDRAAGSSRGGVTMPVPDAAQHEVQRSDVPLIRDLNIE